MRENVVLDLVTLYGAIEIKTEHSTTRKGLLYCVYVILKDFLQIVSD
jgi:hypothetical protein